MRIYAVTTDTRGAEPLAQIEYPWVLMAFGGGDPRELSYRPGLLLDSGAFSAWTTGRTVDVEEYAEFALAVVDEYGAEVRVFNLDVIPGTPGQTPTPEEREYAAEASAANAALLRERGLSVIEVFHLFESPVVFERILERRRPGELVALGGMVFALHRRSAVARAFCDEAFSLLRSWNGGWQGLAPVHGLGVSGDAPLARRYPWFSVDSVAWMARNPNLEVTRGGRFRHRGSAGRPRHAAATALYANRRLASWIRSQDTMTRMWSDRGVTHAE